MLSIFLKKNLKKINIIYLFFIFIINIYKRNMRARVHVNILNIYIFNLGLKVKKYFLRYF